ncbi:hypothetical protein B4065_3027 [Caldibacillus thermoamylovorans]|uniref:Uncharacterized protein n=1 Tax=Caldibacillus thermoamylovorans TaxID=35841 RepID=A0ABD4A7Q9_9BACI|nr:hypothetical protein B4065_3027 [Caldibacillus thermoamylovorans]KIO63499.1 hypothetical protein B4166_3013 [Caldibacillus thermoamylovorans]KIO72859.1 hypothetical protein B4167_2635 [Caldibacillus thermoamylovorans]
MRINEKVILFLGRTFNHNFVKLIYFEMDKLNRNFLKEVG